MDEGQRCPKFGAKEVGLDPWGTGEPREVFEQESLSVQRYSKSWCRSSLDMLKPKVGTPRRKLGVLTVGSHLPGLP